ncbi:MAG: succinylglutamate desuccinylase/aspartoacylase family protein [Candidatus Parcubacteria bacterium]|nr:succinylglutamate desuccinylase/aspartoacylase family protein [Candidatus Parcubacteria bacterium]
MKPKYSFINILTGSDLSTRRLALISTKSPKTGPVIWLTGAVHGDEVGGIIIIQEIFKRLQKYKLLKGAVYALPLMNPIGFETVTRGITLSREDFNRSFDLNRSFPGDKFGTLAERIAYTIFQTIKTSRPALVLDLHNDWINSIPHTLIDPYPGQKHKVTYEKTRTMALKLGLPIINELEEAEQAPELQKSLSGSLLAHNIPAITLEVGGASPVSSIAKEKDVEDGVKAIWDLLTSLGMVKPIAQDFNYQVPDSFKNKILKYSHQPDASTSGVVVYIVKPGEVVKKGQPLAKIYNVFGKHQETLCSLQDSLILGHSDFSVAFPGADLLSFGIL